MSQLVVIKIFYDSTLLHIRRLFDQDACITINEFCAITWLAEKVEEGICVPDALPDELLSSCGDGHSMSCNQGNQRSVTVDTNKKLDEMKIELIRKGNEITEVNFMFVHNTYYCEHLYYFHMF